MKKLSGFQNKVLSQKIIELSNRYTFYFKIGIGIGNDNDNETIN